MQMFELPTEVVDKEFLDIYRRFIAITGAPAWTRRLKRLSETLRTPLERGFYQDSFGLERAMQTVSMHLTRFGTLPSASDPQIYYLYAFIFGTVVVFERLSDKAKNRLRGMLLDGLRSDTGLSPLAFEVAVIAGLARRGCKLGFNDLEGGGGFDFLADSGGLELEVECKTLREDVGRRIKRKAAITVYKSVESGVAKSMPNLKSGVLVKVTVPDSMDTDSGFQSKLSAAILKTLNTGVAEPADDGSYALSIHEFNMSVSPFVAGAESGMVRDHVDDFIFKVAGVRNREAFIHFQPGRAAAVVVLTSALGDRDINRWFREAREAVSTQFSKTRPGILCVHLDGITEEDLVDLASSQKPSASAGGHGLQAAATRILGDEKRSHLVSVVFFGRATSGVQVNGPVISRSGSSYVFHNHLHPASQDERSNVFGIPKVG